MQAARDPAAHLSALRRFRDVAAAMRAIAAGELQAAERARAAARDYDRRVAEAADAVLGPAPDEVGPNAQIVAFVAETGFCAAFDEPVLTAALAAAEGAPPPLLVGRRGARRVREQGKSARVVPMAAHSAGLDDCVARIGREIDPRAPLTLLAWSSQPGMAGLLSRRISPRDPARTIQRAGDRYAKRPLLLETPASLGSAIEREAQFAAIYRFAAESLAAETGARFARMDAACARAGETIEQLSRDAERVRQDRISEEIFEAFGAGATQSIREAR